MPYTTREALIWNDANWTPVILATLNQLSPVEQLKIARELVWREELLLNPLLGKLQDAIASVLRQFNCDDKTISGNLAPDQDWEQIQEDWTNLAASLVTAARFQFDNQLFKMQINSLQPLIDSDKELSDRIHHEQCLHSLYCMDYDSTHKILAEWDVSTSDPAWLLRKSSILWEIGDTVSATELLDSAFTSIRNLPSDSDSFAKPSRESWATLVSIDSAEGPPQFDHLTRLANLGYDPIAETQRVVIPISSNADISSMPSFDIDEPPTLTANFTAFDTHKAPYRPVRLSEITGLPPMNRIHGRINLLKESAVNLADHNLELAVVLILRASSDGTDPTLNKILTRDRIATMSVEFAERLSCRCIRAMEYAYEDLSTELGTRLFQVAAEVLSRVIFRSCPGHCRQPFGYRQILLSKFGPHSGNGFGRVQASVRTYLGSPALQSETSTRLRNVGLTYYKRR